MKGTSLASDNFSQGTPRARVTHSSRARRDQVAGNATVQHLSYYEVRLTTRKPCLA